MWASQCPAQSWKRAPSTLQCALTAKLSITLVSLVSVCTLYTPSLWTFLFQPCNPLWSFQTLQSPVACIHAAPPGGGREVLPWIFCVLGPCSKSRYPMGWGLWLMATLSWKPPPLLFDCSWLPCWNTWELSHTQAPHSFCDLGDPEIWQFYLGFRPTSPPECFSSRDVPHQIGLIKVPVCTPLLYHFLISGLCPPPHQEFIFPYIILDSFLHATPPTLQDVVTFLFVEL